MIIVYIRSHTQLSCKVMLIAHLCHLPSPFQQMWSRPSQGLSVLNIIIHVVRQAIHIHPEKPQRKKLFTDERTLWDIKERKIKTVWVTESTGCRASREQSKPKRSDAKSRAPIVPLLYSLFGGVRVPWCRHGVREWVVIGDVHRSWWPGRETDVFVVNPKLRRLILCYRDLPRPFHFFLFFSLVDFLPFWFC